MKKFILIFPLCALLCSSCLKAPARSPAPSLNYSRPMAVGGKKIFVETVSSPEGMERGLSGRDGIGDGQGMLFKFGKDSLPGFWMKDMKFSLDFIWISDGKIAGITPDAPAPKNPKNRLPVYYPPRPVDSVLEVNAGWSERYKIKAGDEARLEN